jgi:hypothetical protein
VSCLTPRIFETSEGGSDEAIHSFFARRDGLLREVCHQARIHATRWLAMTDVLATRLPDGQITCVFSHTASQARLRKIFRFGRRANQWFLSARLTRQEGRIAIVTKRAVGCGGRGCAFDERH